MLSDVHEGRVVPQRLLLDRTHGGEDVSDVRPEHVLHVLRRPDGVFLHPLWDGGHQHAEEETQLRLRVQQVRGPR